MMPIATYSIYHHGPIFSSNSIACRLLFAPVIFSTSIGPLTMMTVALIRYTKVSYPPFHRRWFASVRFWIWLCIIWTIAFATTIPPVVGFFGKFHYIEPYGVCHIPFNSSSQTIHQRIFYIIFCLGFYMISYIITGACYFLLFFKARQVATRARINTRSSCRSHPVQYSLSSTNSNDLNTVHLTYRLTIVLIILFIGYTLSFGPLALVIVFSMFKLIQLPVLAYAILFTAAYIITVINPLLFILSNDRYQRAIIKFWKKLRCQSCCNGRKRRKINVQQRPD